MTPKAVTAAILMLGLAGAASAAELNARNPIQLAEYLRDKGYRAQLGTDSYGDPKIDTATAGANYTIYFYGCSNNTDCQDLQLRAGFDLTGELSLESVNSWNREKTVGRVYVDDEGDPFIEMFLPGVIDWPEASMDRVLQRWESAMGDFLDFIDW